MSVKQQVSNHLAPNRNSIGIDQYDHAINLIDTTRPASPSEDVESREPEQGTSQETPSIGISAEDSAPVTRIFSKSGLNQELNRRKYARFQEQKYNDEPITDTSKPKGKARAAIKNLDDKRGKALERLHIRAKKARKSEDVGSAVDILYENQRGLFFFGYPLYSSRSLLNFDPSAWSNAEFEDSAVDIRSAQVPDPTWVWSWKRWYVDMSGDVDEQGWQYSLMFGKKFSWHGTHPWFHSAVRRRRWLRRRVKLVHAHHTSDAHDMAQDYFTIHPTRRDPRHEPSITSKDIDKSSRFTSRLEAAQNSEDEEEVDNIVTLLHVMKDTTVDRKKLDAFKSFIQHGEDELQLLPEVLPELWKLFLYQNSARQLLNILEKAEHETALNATEGSSSRSRDLETSIQFIRDHLSQIEYYSDAKAMEREIADHEAGHEENDNHLLISDGQSRLDHVQPSKEPSMDINIETTRISFYGIPKNAGLDVTPGINRPETDNKG